MLPVRAPLALVVAAFAANAMADSDCLKLQNIQKAQSCASKENPFAKVFLAANGELGVTSNVSEISGDFDDFVSNDPENLSSPLLSKALENEGLKLRARAGRLDPDLLSYPIELEAISDRSDPFRGALILSNQGPDVSARDIITAYHRQRLGAGYVATISATHGFSDLRPESKGGTYESIFLDIEKAATFGLVNASYSYTDNNAGGDQLIYVLGGKTQRTSLSLTNWAGSWKFGQALEYTKRSQDMGSFDISTEQQYTSAAAWLGYEAPGLAVTARGKKGVSGSQDFDLVPLLGAFDPHYSSIELEAKARIQVSENMMVIAGGKAFTGTQEMPSSERIGLGGADAGSSHESGRYSGYQGFQNSLSLNYLAFRSDGFTTTLKAGINGAEIKTALDEDIKLESAEAGVEFGFKDFSVNIAHAKTISASNVDYDKRLNAQIVWRY